MGNEEKKTRDGVLEWDSISGAFVRVTSSWKMTNVDFARRVMHREIQVCNPRATQGSGVEE